MDRIKLYLAGPDVFLRDAEVVGQHKRALCTAFGFEGLHPLDNEIDAQGAMVDTAMAIYRGNRAMMREADAIVANLTPFRGPSADVGTGFELGFMAALGKPCFGYSNDARPFLARTREVPGVAPFTGGGWIDADGLHAEDFGLVENLMLDCALRDAGFPLVVHHCDSAARFTDLAAFEACLRLARDHFARR